MGRDLEKEKREAVMEREREKNWITKRDIKQGYDERVAKGAINLQ